MNAVIVSQRPYNIKDVYNDIREKIKETYNLFDDITTKEDLLFNPNSKNIDYIFSTWGMIPLTCDEIKTHLPNLKAIFYAAGTVQSFARPFLEVGVKVFSAWQANGTPVSEIAFSQIILSNKGFYRRRVKQASEWNSNDKERLYPGNFHTKVGLLGAGAIGKKVINLLHNTDLDIYVFDPFLSDEKAKELNVTKLGLVDIFKTCHVISNHLANNDQTKNIINKECFDAMSDNAIFINTGRGAQIDKEAFIDAMKSHPNRLALLDVLDPYEPPKDGDPILNLDNVIITPHVAGSIGNEVKRMAEYMYNESIALSNGDKTKYEVSLSMLETMA